MGKRFFGTDGVRGEANREPITVETVLKLGKALALNLIRTSGRGQKKVLLGKDTRISGSMLEMALSAGIGSMGLDVCLAGDVPTPAVAFLTTDLMCDAGVVISASHNPYEDNGIKFFDSKGLKFDDQREKDIENILTSENIRTDDSMSRDIGQAFRVDDALGRYLVFLKTSVPKGFNLKWLRIVLDCANGAGYKAAPQIFHELGAEIIPLFVSPDGKNINKDCGSMHPEAMTREIARTGADLGIAFDGDGDRAIFADEKGNTIDGDQIMGMVSLDLSERGLLKRNTLVATVMTNMGLETAMKKKGISLLRTAVGDRYVVEAMMRGGYNFGGEQSGHLVFFDYSTTGDGILSALQVASIMKRKGEPLSLLAGWIQKYPQILHNIPVKERVNFDEVPDIKKVVHECEKRLGSTGRILIRYSGTQMLCRVMVEGEDQELVQQIVEELSNALEGNICNG